MALLSIAVLIVVSVLIPIVVSPLVASHGVENIWAGERHSLLLVVVLPVALVVILVLVGEPRGLLVGVPVLVGVVLVGVVLVILKGHGGHLVVPLVVVVGLLARRARTAVVLLALLPTVAA